MDSLGSSQPDHYETLGLSPDASGREVEEAFHSRVRQHLQNANLSDKPIRERARQVGLAYETLRDPAKRRAYDEARAAEAEPTPPPPVDPVAREPLRSMAFAPAAAQGVPPPAAAEPPESPPFEPPPATTRSVDANPVEPRSFTPQPLVPPAVAAAPVAPAEVHLPPAEHALAPEAEETEAERPAADEVAAPIEEEETTAPAGGALVATDNATPPHEVGLVPWEEERSSGLRRGVIAGGALVIALGIGGALLFMRGGGHAGQTRAGGSTRIAATAGQTPAGSTASLELPSAPAGPPSTVPPDVAATSATAGRPQVAPRPGSPVAAVVRPGGAVTLPLPPPAPSTAQASGTPQPSAAAAPAPAGTGSNAESSTPPAQQATAAPAPAAAAPPAAIVPPPLPAPVLHARPVQPFPRWLGGGIMNSDNPHGIFQGTVGVRFTVEPNGQVSNCRAVSSSGDPSLDSRTCGLVEQRLRFAPARNSAGTPMASDVRTTYTWGRVTRGR